MSDHGLDAWLRASPVHHRRVAVLRGMRRFEQAVDGYLILVVERKRGLTFTPFIVGTTQFYCESA